MTMQQKIAEIREDPALQRPISESPKGVCQTLDTIFLSEVDFSQTSQFGCHDPPARARIKVAIRFYSEMNDVPDASDLGLRIQHCIFGVYANTDKCEIYADDGRFFRHLD